MYTVVKVFFLVLCSGLLQFSSAANRLRWFNYSEGDYTWSEAQNKCLSKGGSLLSLYDEEDLNMIRNFSLSLNTTIFNIWLGLKRNPSYVPKWSNGEKVMFNESTANLKKGEQLCEAIENGTWKSFKCSEERAFMCQNGTNYTLVELKENWCQAMQHCRTHFTDLASISDEQQNEELKNKSLGKSFWIGLQHDEWEQADKSCSTYREKTEITKDAEECVIIYGEGITWKPMSCEHEYAIICYKGWIKIRIIEESKTWEEALDYCKAKHSRLLWIEDQEDQFAVEQWLNFTYTGSTRRLWIGMRQSSVLGFWIWSDRIVNYHNWENDPQPVIPLSKRCGVINAYTYKWSDEDCEGKLPFLCEEDIIYMQL